MRRSAHARRRSAAKPTSPRVPSAATIQGQGGCDAKMPPRRPPRRSEKRSRQDSPLSGRERREHCVRANGRWRLASPLTSWFLAPGAYVQVCPLSDHLALWSHAEVSRPEKCPVDILCGRRLHRKLGLSAECWSGLVMHIWRLKCMSAYVLISGEWRRESKPGHRSRCCAKSPSIEDTSGVATPEAAVAKLATSRDLFSDQTCAPPRCGICAGDNATGRSHPRPHPISPTSPCASSAPPAGVMIG